MLTGQPIRLTGQPIRLTGQPIRLAGQDIKLVHGTTLVHGVTLVHGITLAGQSLLEPLPLPLQAMRPPGTATTAPATAIRFMASRLVMRASRFSGIRVPLSLSSLVSLLIRSPLP